MGAYRLLVSLTACYLQLPRGSVLQSLRAKLAAVLAEVHDRLYVARALWLEGFNICLKGLLGSAMSRSVLRSPFCPTYAIAPNNVTVTLLGALACVGKRVT